jgi:hypothetical protein
LNDCHGCPSCRTETAGEQQTATQLRDSATLQHRFRHSTERRRNDTDHTDIMDGTEPGDLIGSQLSAALRERSQTADAAEWKLSQKLSMSARAMFRQEPHCCEKSRGGNPI